MSTDSMSPQTVEQFLSGKVTQINVASLERELRELWASATSAQSEDNRRAVARACVLNLVLYTCDTDAETSAANLLDEITVHHPCRAILAIARASEAPNLEAWVSARCHLPSPGSTKQICCEQITVRWEGHGVQELPSVVTPLLVADLPVFLWWRSANFDPDAVGPFLEYANRLIVDTDRWNSGYRFFVSLNDCIQNSRKRLAVTDLNWTRLEPWRRMLARSFDVGGIGLTVEDLANVESVEISHTVASSTQSILLLGWLAARLGWRPSAVKSVDTTSGEVTFSGKNRTVEARWKSQPPDSVPNGAVVAVALKLGSGRSLDCRIECKENKPIIIGESHIEGQSKQFVVNGPEFDEGRLVDHALEILRHDYVYEQAVALAADIIGRA